MKYCVSISFFVLLVLCAFGIAIPTYAQLDQTTGPSVDLQIVPDYPGPNQTVSASIESYSTNLDAASITWKVNGKIKKTGMGEKRFGFIVGDMNTTTSLVVSIETKGGAVIEKTYNIKPTSVDLFWQTDGYVPPFYKGKTLFSHQNKIQFIAMPHILNQGGQEVSPKNLIYKWTRNGTVLGDYSGYGKYTYTMIASVISRPINMEVEVSSPDLDGVGYTQTTVTPIEPTVMMYEKNPLYGIQFQKALVGTVELNNSKEIIVAGFPLFFGVGSVLSSDLSYKWAINGIPIDKDTRATVRVFRQKEGVSGTSNISLSVENSNKILQYSSNNFDLKFSNVNNETNPSGF